MPEEFKFIKYSDKKEIDDVFTIKADTLTLSGFICGADGPIISYVRLR